MSVDRWLDWDGCCNARDLGGLAAADGRRTRWGAIVRADGLDRLTPAGWAALVAHGVRTIVDLRDDSERKDLPARRDGVTTVHVPLDDTADTDFWDYVRDNEFDCTPLYYPAFLERKPERCARAIAAVAHAGPGGVVIHCAVGRDRTGLVSLLLLALVGVAAEDIATDYLLSEPRLVPLFRELGYREQAPIIADIHARKGITAHESIAETVASLDDSGYLRAAGVTDAELAAVRERLLD